MYSVGKKPTMAAVLISDRSETLQVKTQSEMAMMPTTSKLARSRGSTLRFVARQTFGTLTTE